MDCRLDERCLLRSSVFRAAFAGALLAGLASGTQAFADPTNPPAPSTVPRAKCGPQDHPETALQGQVPAALRATGFNGFSCNLELIGQVRGDGANWQTDEYRERQGHNGKGKAKGEGNGNQSD